MEIDSVSSINVKSNHDTERAKLSVIEVLKQESSFLLFIGVAVIIAAFVFNDPQLAMWFGFALAGYSAIANDSIQTIGTFIASNQDKRWWHLWLYIGGIFVVTVFYSWVTYNGDVSSQRLTAKGFAKAPESFAFLQIAAPIFLLILTRLRMPVSTTFLLLSSFSTKSGAIASVMIKSVSGYFLAFTIAIVVWMLLAKVIRKYMVGKPHPAWTIAQWITSGWLWSVWIMQDAANIAVYLPRQLSLTQFIIFAGYIFFGLAILFYLKGDRIQGVVTEKSAITDVRAATLIDFIYAIILYYFKVVSVIPMSTTWVFIGLLGGREIAMSLTDAEGSGKPLKQSLRIIGKDVLFAAIGLFVSIIIAFAVNPKMQEELNVLLGLL
ncbi:conserved hypothetical protein [Chloroherpeton thalassium ATCC 35110]|uniref:Phosphate/sulfate permease n=1 Tax=Chloroherpeton thalassium (strain ATCC 35110 / GB-78) TaxID=517418 RepID=B3QRP4_CHLT3|nr:hypothetical protein [Chloroherpeton thalassium]ACF13847.1 conserved hypothetical protein [Chloroherpeton thalassium ATCC 35110]